MLPAVLLQVLVMLLVVVLPPVISYVVIRICRHLRDKPALNPNKNTRLNAARSEARLMRLVVSGALLAIGWSLFATSMVWYMAWKLVGEATGNTALQGNHFLAFGPIGGCLMLLSLTPQDQLAIRTVVIAIVASFSLLAVAFVYLAIQNHQTPFNLAVFVVDFVLVTPPVCVLTPLLLHRGRTAPRAMLSRVWFVVRCLLATAAALFAAWLALRCATQDFAATPDFPGLAALATSSMLCALATAPRNRVALHRFMLKRYRAGEARTSAMIAAMMGRSSHEQVLRLAEKSFRVLPLAGITEAHLASNADTDMFSLTQKMPLGSCDAFISHSWSDPGERKHEVLTEWHEEFRKAYERSADVWLDKACINQSNIAESLACLPVYVGGCSRLIVLVGRTYCTRLWCIMECFVWLQMGGGLSNIDVIHLQEDEPNNERRSLRESRGDHQSLAHTIASFRTKDAQCRSKEDRDNLIGVIETAFADISDFDSQVIRMLGGKAKGRHPHTVVV